YTYLKMAIDNVYAMEYENKWTQMEVTHAKLKPIMITVGIGMVLLGAAQIAAASLPTAGLAAFTGVPTMLFGIDMIGSNLFGFSVFDELLKGGLYGYTAALGQDTKFIKEKGFSFFRFTSNQMQNLILTQLTFMLLGEVFSVGAGIRGLARNMAVGTSQTEVKVVGTVVTYNSKVLTGADVLEMTYKELYDQLRVIGSLGDFVLRYATEQVIHLATGTLFLFALGAAGSLGDIGFLGDMAIQGIMLASIIIGIRNTIKTSKLYSPSQMIEFNQITESSKYFHISESLKMALSGKNSAGVSIPLAYRTSLVLGILAQGAQIAVSGLSVIV
ncbi:MAG: hypothetical protein P1Q69_20185, partial [Candidatus Thorarchaeota archaeon]|nr:hypothetical protein [Candidatus Thorarchaeota archaeon]